MDNLILKIAGLIEYGTNRTADISLANTAEMADVSVFAKDVVNEARRIKAQWQQMTDAQKLKVGFELVNKINGACNGKAQ